MQVVIWGKKIWAILMKSQAKIWGYFSISFPKLENLSKIKTGINTYFTRT